MNREQQQLQMQINDELARQIGHLVMQNISLQAHLNAAASRETTGERADVVSPEGGAE